MTWLSTFYLKAFVVLLQVVFISSDDNGPLPGFKQHPLDTLIISANQTIFCGVHGEKPLKISWLKDNHQINTKTSEHITISKEGSLNLFFTKRSRDEGSYRCMVENKYGRLFSKAAKVTFPYLNEFVAPDTRIEVKEGDQAILECRAPESYPDRHIFWSKFRGSNSVIRIEETSHYSQSREGDLYFSYVNLSDSGVYYCSVENSELQKMEKRLVNFKVKKRPQRNIRPQIWKFSDRFAMKGSNFMLECIAYGRPIPTLSFRNVKTGSKLLGTKQYGNLLRYEFGTFTEHDEGEYACDAVNIYGQKSTKIAFIKMQGKPEMLFKSRDLQVAVKSTVQLPCVATGVPDVTYEWYSNGIRLSSNSQFQIHKGNLTITRVKKHQAFYQCLAHNRHGEDLLTYHVNVVETPACFAIKPARSTEALVGGSTEINCVPCGAPKPTIRWRKVGTDTDVITQDERFTVRTTGTLKISNLKESDAGTYECIASNKLKTVKTSGTLNVHSGLAITEELSKEDVFIIGKKITLKCTCNTFEKIEVTFKWFRGRKQLRKSNRNRIQNSRRQSVLEIGNAKFNDTGRYKCKAIATKKRFATKTRMIIVAGRTEPVTVVTQRPPFVKTTTVPYRRSTTKLSVRGPPDPPKDVNANEASGLDIKISWTMGKDNGDLAKRIYIQARTTFEMDVWHTIKISNNTKNERESEMVRLSPWVEYKIRVISENKYGKSEPSEETIKWIRTPTATPTVYPTNIKGIGTGPNELTVSFDPLDEIDQNAPGIRYYIHYRARGSTHLPIMREIPKEKSWIKLSFLNTDYDAYYKPYEFQLQAKNDKGFGPKSIIQIAYTGERVPIAAPRNLKCKLEDNNQLKAEWDEVSKDRTTMRGKFVGYKLIYWKSRQSHDANYVITTEAKVTLKLDAFSTYKFEVLAYNSAGNGPSSKEVGPIKTLEGVPSKPTYFEVEDATLSEATLSWDEPLTPNGYIVHYKLTYELGGKQKTMKFTPDQKRVVLKDLSESRKYNFSLKAATKAGESRAAEISLDLSKVPKLKLASPVVSGRGFNSIVLTWISAPKDVVISGYKIFYWKSGSSELKARALWEQSNDIIATVDKLEAGAEYFFQIAIVNKFGTGPRSSKTRAKTKFRNIGIDPIINGSSHCVIFSNYIIALFFLIAVLVPR